MSTDQRKMIAINWKRLGLYLQSLLNYIKWPATLITMTYLAVSLHTYPNSVRLDWELILKYLSTVIWPLVVVVTLRHVRPDLPNLLDRLEELNILGNNAKFRNNQNQPTETRVDDLKDIAPDAIDATEKTAADFQIADNETHALLTSYDAAVAYAQVYADIFGTQIDVLKKLLDYSSGINASSLQSILDEHRRASNNKGFSDVVSYMQFLLRNTLVIYNPQTQIYQLTNAGYYFLVFLHKAGLLGRPKTW